jgi:uroporphyrinogen decarboxylase
MAARVNESLGIIDDEFYNPHGGGNTYLMERSLGVDMFLTSVGWANSYYASHEYGVSGSSYTDEWGVVWKSVEYQTKYGPGHYTEMVGHPLSDENAFTSYRPPDPTRPELYIDAQWTVEEFQEEYWITGATVTTIFETAWALRGYQKTLMDFVLNPDLVEELLDIPYRYHLAAAKKLTELGVDMLWLGDDVGAQEKMLISPDTWRRFLKPRMAELISSVKDINPSLKIAYHSDGYITPIIPELIEIGVDVLNPIQPQSMEPAEIKNRFGDKLCFWGSIDEQHTLPFGTPEEVRKEVVERLRTIGKGGGLIIGPTHNVQLDTPMENFRALVDTVNSTSYESL